MQDTRDPANTNRWLGWALLVPALCCHTAHAQGVTPATQEPAYDLGADAERDLVIIRRTALQMAVTLRRPPPPPGAPPRGGGGGDDGGGGGGA